MNDIVIIDYNMGNLRSVQKAFERLGCSVLISNNRDIILKSDKLILPGVGHFAEGMKNLRKLKLIDTLKEAVIESKKDILGICLGMQLMTESSEEGEVAGLGWIKGRAKRFVFDENRLKVPHMGWNNLFIANSNSILKDITHEDLFYFVHSYYVSCDNRNDVLAETEYENKFVSSLQNKNLFGCQFHPEKSHDVGLKVIHNFCTL